MTVTVLTAIFGQYDVVKPFVPQSVDTRFVLVTDTRPHPSSKWEPIVCRDVNRMPRLAAKGPKLDPWTFVPKASSVIWIDGSMEIISPTFVEEALDSTERLGQWDHPDRVCSYDEAAFSATLPKYKGQPLADQIRAYQADGFPENWGLWAAGLIVYKQPNPSLTARWQQEIYRWGIQDQVSQPYALWKVGARPESLPYGLLSNPWIRLIYHRDATL